MTTRGAQLIKKSLARVGLAAAMLIAIALTLSARAPSGLIEHRAPVTIDD